jgi:hypothetical protein
MDPTKKSIFLLEHEKSDYLTKIIMHFCVCQDIYDCRKFKVVFANQLDDINI